MRKSLDFKSLNEGQQITALAVLSGGNMLISGGGGVGKSHLIRFLATYINDLVITASTGIASINIAGQTIDSFMGFSRNIATPRQAVNMDDSVKERLSLLRVLLIDEVSMTRADKLDMIDQRLRAAKGNMLPFGGVQIILVGDFCQLPPVVSNQFADLRYKTEYGKRLFAFESDVYDNAEFTPYVLNEYVRQGDEETRRVLRNMRMGHKLKEVTDYLNTSARGNVNHDSLRICKTNQRVNEINLRAFHQLTTPDFTSKAVRKGNFPLGSATSDARIPLRKGCRLLMTVNNPDEGFLNGDLGSLLGFQGNNLLVQLDRGKTVLVKPHTWENHAYVVDHNNDQLEKGVIGSFIQFPVRLGYAITGHKSQGMTLDSAVVDFSGNFNADGLAYVVISRVRSMKNLQLTHPIRVSDIRTSKIAKKFTYDISMKALNRRDTDRRDILKAA
jgi:ATP-dependent DNA helicase PIF1